MRRLRLEARLLRLLRRGRAAELNDQRNAARGELAHLGRRESRLVLVVLIGKLDLLPEHAAGRVDFLERQLEALLLDPREFGGVPGVVGDDADLDGVLGPRRRSEEEQAEDDHAERAHT